MRGVGGEKKYGGKKEKGAIRMFLNGFPLFFHLFCLFNPFIAIVGFNFTSNVMFILKMSRYSLPFCLF